MTSSFITNAASLLLIGPSGLGKTHLSIALGTKMVQLGFTVRFLVAQQLANTVLAATTRLEVTKIINPLITCDLLILDEFGYLALEPQVGPVLYEIIAGRYEKGATVITSNKSLTRLRRNGRRHSLNDGHYRSTFAPWRGLLLAWNFLPHAWKRTC